MSDNSNQANTIDELTLLLMFRLLSERKRQAVLSIVLASAKLKTEPNK